VVESLERSIDFYVEHFEAEVEFFSEAIGEDVAQLHGLEGEADFTVAIVRIGDGLIELLEFRSPTGVEAPTIRGCDVGSSHIAIQVDDIEEKYRTLSDAGVAFTRPPLRRDEGELGEFSLAFLTDPDGNRVELVQVSNGRQDLDVGELELDHALDQEGQVAERLRRAGGVDALQDHDRT
jgi:catechol 2,3-dioxygenase-like lactoylglutathione lyase family enzyme